MAIPVTPQSQCRTVIAGAQHSTTPQGSSTPVQRMRSLTPSRSSRSFNAPNGRQGSFNAPSGRQGPSQPQQFHIGPSRQSSQHAFPPRPGATLSQMAREPAQAQQQGIVAQAPMRASSPSPMQTNRSVPSPMQTNRCVSTAPVASPMQSNRTVPSPMQTNRCVSPAPLPTMPTRASSSQQTFATQAQGLAGAQWSKPQVSQQDLQCGVEAVRPVTHQVQRNSGSYVPPSRQQHASYVAHPQRQVSREPQRSCGSHPQRQQSQEPQRGSCSEPSQLQQRAHIAQVIALDPQDQPQQPRAGSYVHPGPPRGTVEQAVTSCVRAVEQAVISCALQPSCQLLQSTGPHTQTDNYRSHHQAASRSPSPLQRQPSQEIIGTHSVGRQNSYALPISHSAYQSPQTAQYRQLACLRTQGCVSLEADPSHRHVQQFATNNVVGCAQAANEQNNGLPRKPSNEELRIQCAKQSPACVGKQIVKVDELSKTQEIYVYKEKQGSHVGNVDELAVSVDMGKENKSFHGLNTSADSIYICAGETAPSESPIMVCESLILVDGSRPETASEVHSIEEVGHVQRLQIEGSETHEQVNHSQIGITTIDNSTSVHLNCTINHPTTPQPPGATLQTTPVSERQEVPQPEPEDSLTRTSLIEGRRTSAPRSSWRPSDQGPVYGLDAELKAKADDKYNLTAEDEVAQWVEAITGVQVMGEFGEALRTGQVLCQLINAIKPGTIKKINDAGRPFKERENISMFISTCRKWGVHEYALFSTDDLYDEKNLASVVKCIYQLGGVLRRAVPEFPGPHLGVADCSNAKRDAKRDLAPASQTEGLKNAMGRSHIDILSTGNVRGPLARGGC